MPTTPVFTEPETVTIPVPCDASDQIAPLSTYHESCQIVMSPDHSKTTVGSVLSIASGYILEKYDVFPTRSAERTHRYMPL
jgi:hypothetical protein